MSTTMKFHSDAVIRRSLHLLVAGALLAGFAHGQAGQNHPANAGGTVDKDTISAAIDKARQDGDTSIYYVEQIAEARAVQAVPMLEEKFARAPRGPSKNPSWDALDKAHVASALVRLGDKKDIYWDYLVKQATQSVENDAPDPMSYDSQGKSLPGISPEFEAWANAHKLAHAGLWDQYRYLLAGPVMLLGLTGDPRAVPLLRRGLLSRNYMVEEVSAMGLAQIGDKDSVPFIIQACKRAPAEAAAVIAESLVYFDDPEAQKAVDEYIPKDAAQALREGRAQGRKPFGD